MLRSIQKLIALSPSPVEVILKWEKPGSSPLLIFDAGQKVVSQYLQAFDVLRQSPTDHDKLISDALKRLSREFDAVLKRLTHLQAGAASTLPTSTTESSSVTDSTGIPSRFEDYAKAILEIQGDVLIDYLRSIALRMSSMDKIVKYYTENRRSFLEKHLKSFGFEEILVYEGVSWDALQPKMGIWGDLSRILVCLIQYEKQLCEKIFGDHAVRDKCFIQTVGNIAVKLIRFARGMGFQKKQPYHGMERVLDLYSCFIWFKAEADALFVSKTGETIRKLCQETLFNIKKEMETMLRDLRKDVADEHYEVPDNSCEALLLTREVMHQVSLIARNGNQLASLTIKAPPSNVDGLIIHHDDMHDRSPLDMHFIFIVAVLHLKLSRKSKSYNNQSSRLLFMMNNTHFMIRSIERSNKLQESIGSETLRRLKEDLDLKASSYLASTCKELVNCFDEKGLRRREWFKSLYHKAAAKRIQAFNSALETMQSSLHPLGMIKDSELRTRVCDLLHATVSPAYIKFLDKLEKNQELGLLLQQNAKYPPENLRHVLYEKSSVHA